MALLSHDAVTTLVLSLLIATQVIALVCPESIYNLIPVVKAQMIAVLSKDPVTTLVLSLLMAMLYI